MPWRDNPAPYNVVVSEIMLQQTQVPRVLPKFVTFVSRFPGFASLAHAPLHDVLAEWSGLGYNRRAKFLWEAAKAVERDYNGSLPSTVEELVTLPGIGPNTAGAIITYVYDQPVVFVETNIRTCIIHHFFADYDQKVTDNQIKSIVENTLPSENFRQWYWALMDYGAYLKSTSGAQLQRVHNYRKQSKFKGSRRQVRGEVLRILLKGDSTFNELDRMTRDERLAEVLHALQQEGLIIETKGQWHLTGYV